MDSDDNGLSTAGGFTVNTGPPGVDGTPGWAYDEDGYCTCCGNGRWKFHMPGCHLRDTLDLVIDLAPAAAPAEVPHRPHTMHWDVTPDGDILCTEGSPADAVAYWAALRGGQWHIVHYTDCLTYDGRTHVTVRRG